MNRLFSNAIGRSIGFALPALLSMLLVVRLLFGDWFWTIQAWALLTLLVMIAHTVAVRGVGKKIGPQAGAMVMLGANIGRIGIGLIAMILILKLQRDKFPPFCTSTMIGYMYYLVAEIFELILESKRD